MFDENMNKVQRKIDDMKKSQAQCEETIRLKNKMMVLKYLVLKCCYDENVFRIFRLFSTQILGLCT